MLEEIEQYIKKQESLKVCLSKITIDEELFHQSNINHLEPFPTNFLDAYIYELNPRIDKQLQVPDARDIFDGGPFTAFPGDDCIILHTESLKVRLKQSNYISVSKTLPNPMLDILYPPNVEENYLQQDDQIQVVQYQVGYGESECTTWQIKTGSDIDLFKIRQNRIALIDPSNTQGSLPWEGTYQN